MQLQQLTSKSTKIPEAEAWGKLRENFTFIFVQLWFFNLVFGKSLQC